MIHFERIRNKTHPAFSCALKLYQISFPIHEQREELSQAKILCDNAYHFELIYDCLLYTSRCVSETATVQMPGGIPVATVAINGGENAAILAVQILSLKYSELKEKLRQFKQDMLEKVLKDDASLQEEVAK